MKINKFKLSFFIFCLSFSCYLEKENKSKKHHECDIFVKIVGSYVEGDTVNILTYSQNIGGSKIMTQNAINKVKIIDKIPFMVEIIGFCYISHKKIHNEFRCGDTINIALRNSKKMIREDE